MLTARRSARIGPIGRSLAAGRRRAEPRPRPRRRRRAPSWGRAATAGSPPSAARIVGAALVLAEGRGRPDLVDDQQVAALAGQLGPAERQHVAGVVAGLGGEADQHLTGAPRAGRPRWTSSASTSGLRTSSRSEPVGRPPGRRVGLLDLVRRRRSPGGSRRPRRPSRRRRPPRRRRSTASRSSAAVPTGTTSTPAGRRRRRQLDSWPRPGSPRRPRAAAARASATPCWPEERLPRKRTGSSGSRVPPAVTTTVRPARSCGRPRRPRASSGQARGEQLLGLGQPARAGVGAGQPAGRRAR